MHDDSMFIIQLSFIDGQIKFSQDIEQRQLAITQILRNIYINSISYLIMRVIITAYSGDPIHLDKLFIAFEIKLKFNVITFVLINFC